jgi:hypothetical protein
MQEEHGRGVRAARLAIEYFKTVDPCRFEGDGSRFHGGESERVLYNSLLF